METMRHILKKIVTSWIAEYGYSWEYTTCYWEWLQGNIIPYYPKKTFVQKRALSFGTYDAVAFLK